jgi:hypothetical protein
MKIWFDFVNVPHAHFLSVIRGHFLNKHIIFCTARDFAELKSLLNQKNIEFKMIGSHYRGKFFKIFGSIARCFSLWKNIPPYDLSISCGSHEAALFSKIKGKKTVVFDDNDISPNWLYAPFTDYFICPSKFNIDKIIHQGIKKQNIYNYDGYKEDIYLADYKPDPDFINKIPFKEYFVVRPENLSASYIKGKNKKSITPELLKSLSGNGNNIVFLPRYKHERVYAEGLKNIYIPSDVLNGLDLCFYSKAVFTGAGTLAREAACLGVPAVSFFPGDNLLSVDQDMINKGWVFYSLNIEDIVGCISKFKKRAFDAERCKKTQSQVFGILEEIFEKISKVL